VVRVDTRSDDTFKLIRFACNDPGAFVKRGGQLDGTPNTLGQWQAQAVLAALGAAGGEPQWEYLCTHDCDGTVAGYWRRRPTIPAREAAGVGEQHG
jgi:hypothetical protein